MKYLFMLILGLYTIGGYSQTELNYHDQLFNNLSNSKLSTNILANRVGLPDTLFGMNGNINCIPSSYNSWEYAYRILYYGDIGTPSIPTIETIQSQVPNEPTSEIKINGLYYNYDYLSSNAVSNGLIQLIDTLFYDGPNSGNPYLQKTCVAVSPMFPNSMPPNLSFRGGDIFGNLSSDISTASIDFSDGNGYRTFDSNTLYSIYYSNEGTYYITLRLTLNNGSSVYAKSKINISASAAPLKSSNVWGFPDSYSCKESTGIVPDENQTISVSRSGLNNDALIKIWYGKDANGLPKTSLTKPIIISDGYDPVSLTFAERSAEEIYFKTNYNDTYDDETLFGTCENAEDQRMNNISEGLLDRLRNLGYDIAIVDYQWGGLDITENAISLRNCITEINNILTQNSSDEELVVMGPSMGALVCRVALSEMTNHNTRLYISYDGPQQGANVPMPIQMLFGEVKDKIDERIGGLFGFLFDKYSDQPLDCPAAKQMLRAHYGGMALNQGLLAASEHVTLYNDIDGQYPANCLNVAIACADGAGNEQSTFSGITKGDNYFGPTKGDKIKRGIEFYELPDNGSWSKYLKVQVFSEIFGMKLYYFNRTYYSKSTSYNKSLERYPGSYFDAAQIVRDFLNYDATRFECFMPLFTSLDLSTGVTNNIFSEFNIPSGRNFTKNIYPTKSPFDVLYVCNENKYHVNRGPEAAVPGMNNDMCNFIVFIVDNSKNIEYATQQEVFDMYDIFMNDGIQTCAMNFNTGLLSNGVIKKSYNSSSIDISNVTFGEDGDLEIYSEQSITIGNNVTIGTGGSVFINGGNCLSQ